MPPSRTEAQEITGDAGARDARLQPTAAGKVADFRSLPSPIPLIRLYRTLNRLQAGSELTILTNERGTVEEFKAFARMTGHALLDQRESGDGYVHVFRRR